MVIAKRQKVVCNILNKAGKKQYGKKANFKAVSNLIEEFTGQAWKEGQILFGYVWSSPDKCGTYRVTKVMAKWAYIQRIDPYNTWEKPKRRKISWADKGGFKKPAVMDGCVVVREERL